MEEKDIQLEQLMVEKLAGVIGEEDELYLDGLIQKEEQVWKQWTDLKQTFEEEGAKDYLQKIDNSYAWRKVEQGISEKRRYRLKRRKSWAVAASLMIPLLLAGWFYFHWENKNALLAEHSVPSVNHVQLLVNGSSAINLSQYKKNTSVSATNNINLKVNKSSMSYVAVQDDKIKDALNTLVVPATETYTITLSDGTEVSLNSMSQLKFSFSLGTDKREVWLEGEAYFEVAEDESRPFIVHTPKTAIQVLGTNFNVNTYDSSQIKTSLVSGSVKTTASDQAILLKPGYEATYSSETGFDTHTFESNQVLSWMRGVYYFQNSSLKDIASVIHRWYGDSIEFAHPEIAKSHYTGALLKNKPLKDFLDNLAFTSNIQYEKLEGVIVLGEK